MYIGNNYMVNVKSVKTSSYHQEYFIDEKSAKEYANSCWINGAYEIELFQRGRQGYTSVKHIFRHHEGAQIWIEK